MGNRPDRRMSRWGVVLGAVVALLAAAPSASAAGAFLVRDINSGGAGSAPHSFASVGGTAYFAAGDGAHGVELWRSDGTQAGTRMVKDIWPGAPDGRPQFLTAVGATVYFEADDGVHGDELWRSDGTAAGTRLVRDIADGTGDSSDSNPYPVTHIGNKLIFRARNGRFGNELWRSNGTRAGTKLVRDINPGHHGSDPGYSDAAVVGGIAYFAATDDTHGTELWRSDGTNAGTKLVRNIYRGIGNSGPNDFTNVAGTLLFAAKDGGHGLELWRSDGTSGGTKLVKDIYPYGHAGSDLIELTNVGGILMFGAATSYPNGRPSYQLFRSDGTAAGTGIVRKIKGGGGAELSNLTNVGGRLFFSADDGNVRHAVEPWTSDGTFSGTRILRDINPDSGNSLPADFTDVDGTAFFAANFPGFDRELWRSNGTEAGTVRVRNINPGQSSNPQDLTDVGGTLFFSADDGSHGRELWKAVP